MSWLPVQAGVSSCPPAPLTGLRGEQMTSCSGISGRRWSNRSEMLPFLWKREENLHLQPKELDGQVPFPDRNYEPPQNCNTPALLGVRIGIRMNDLTEKSLMPDVRTPE